MIVIWVILMKIMWIANESTWGTGDVQGIGEGENGNACVDL